MESFQQASGCLHRLVSGPQVWPTAKHPVGEEIGELGAGLAAEFKESDAKGR